MRKKKIVSFLLPFLCYATMTFADAPAPTPVAAPVNEPQKALAPDAVKPKEKWYHVEVLVLESWDKSALSEDWPLDPGKPSFSNAVTVSNDPKANFGKLPEDELTLKEIKQKLKNKYRIVMEESWRQTIPAQAATKVHLTGGKPYDGNNEVNGFIKLSAGRYIHADVDFLFTKPLVVKPASNKQESMARFSETTAKKRTGYGRQGGYGQGYGRGYGQGYGRGYGPDQDGFRQEYRQEYRPEPRNELRMQTFRLKGISRLRAHELHYIDHPLYGIIVMVTPEAQHDEPAS